MQNVWAVQYVWLQTKCMHFVLKVQNVLLQTFCKQNVWHFIECKVAFCTKKPNEMHEALRLRALHRM